MSDNLKQMVDLDDEQLGAVPLGRNRILRAGCGAIWPRYQVECAITDINCPC
jgi:hypothetical protein